MIKRILKDQKVRASFWGLLLAVIVAAGGGMIDEGHAGKILDGLAYTLPTVIPALWVGWRGAKKAAELPPSGGADHG